MIYCVEDDQSIRDLMVYTLKTSGYDAEGFESGEEFFDALESHKPELILLDIMLPGKDGIEILKTLRHRPDTMQIPVIMASAKGSEYDKITGLDLGADDYIAKPFGMMEMVSRVRAVLRRTAPSGKETSEQAILQYGKLEMDIQSHTVTLTGEPVQLTLKEYEILHLLLTNQGRVYKREELLDLIWGMDYMGESRTVDVHIGTLRSKLGKVGQNIVTVRGVGYKIEK